MSDHSSLISAFPSAAVPSLGSGRSRTLKACAAAVAALLLAFAPAAPATTTTIPAPVRLGHALVVGADPNDTRNLTTITFGFLRMTGVDSHNTLAACLSAIRLANDEGALVGFRYQLDVSSIDCADDAGCVSALNTATGKAQVAAFLAKIPTFMAILRPCHVVAPQIIDGATATGGVPVIDPITIRQKDLNTEHVIRTCGWRSAASSSTCSRRMGAPRAASCSTTSPR